MEKTMILAMATGQKRSASLCKLVEKYAEILASQGLLTTAMKYLNFMGNEELTPELVILRDCIALSTEPGITLSFLISKLPLFMYTIIMYVYRLHFINSQLVGNLWTLFCFPSNHDLYKHCFAPFIIS